jgi:MinD superfamily P-loop ATPase
MQIAVASGKGGTGKTTLAVSLFHYWAKYQNKKVHLLDCDVEEPNDALFLSPLKTLNSRNIHQYIPEIDTSVCTFCKKCVEWCEFNAITIVANRQFAEVDTSLCHSCGACLVACPENAFTEKPHPAGCYNPLQDRKRKFLYRRQTGSGLSYANHAHQRTKKRGKQNGYYHSRRSARNQLSGGGNSF